MSESNQGEFEKYITKKREDSGKELSERFDSVLKVVQEYKHPQEHVRNKFNEVVSVLQERGLSADARIIQDFVLRFETTILSLWRKEGPKILIDGQKIIDSIPQGEESKYESQLGRIGIPIAFQYSDVDGEVSGRFFDSYYGKGIIRADTPETQEIIKLELESNDPNIKREFIKCRLTEEAERILHKTLGTLDKRNYFDTEEVPSLLNGAVQKRGFDYEQKIPSLKGCWLVVKKEFSSQHDYEVPDICGVEITVHPDRLFLASAMEEIRERENVVIHGS